MCNRMYSEDACQSDSEGDEPSVDVILDAVGLCKEQKFTLYHALGNDWMFVISHYMTGKVPFHIYIEDNFPLESSFPLCYTDNGFCF